MSLVIRQQNQSRCLPQYILGLPGLLQTIRIHSWQRGRTPLALLENIETSKSTEHAHPRASVYEREPRGNDSQEIFCTDGLSKSFPCDIIYDKRVVIPHLIETNERTGKKKKSACFEISRNFDHKLPARRSSMSHQ